MKKLKLLVGVSLVAALGLTVPAIAETTPPQPVSLLQAGNFLVLSGAGIQNLAGPSLYFNGNLGTSPATGSTITGISKAQVGGWIYTVDATGPTGSTVDPAYLTTAKGAITTAYNDAFGRVLARVTQGPELGGLTLGPGVYWSATGFSISSGDLVLDSFGNPDAVWIFQAGTAGAPTDVTLNSTRHVTMAHGALAAKVFWVCRSAFLGTDSSFRGIVLADQSVTNAGNGIFEGRQLAFSGSVTLNGASSPSFSVPLGLGSSDPSKSRDGSYIYPSPTRGPLANIAYVMTDTGKVRIDIYNEGGRLADTIEDIKHRGWQSSEVSVGKFAPGTYFYILKIDYDNGAKEIKTRHKFAVIH